MKNGVFPVYENQFKINTKGREAGEENKKTIADMETFQPKINGNVVEWDAIDQKGWKRRLMTGKDLSISFKGKRNIGDAGNDYIAGLALKNGTDVNSILDWTFPDGTIVSIPCVVNVTLCGGGESNDADGLEFEILSDGKPTVSAAAI